ncbi:hypothetical protein GCM10010156_20620 [Planobispora rosea]|uniref:Uncharacterized protein n=1 Tax=Planobispora rosea TaxID=35762 RepID=A0A8J3S4B8_PLARO|nr:hypothetical protein GCM10010156_20620 [Planobispora rosea]GIH86565.1 hypothetical protein Pro02_49730 [Planobispora rosea]
MESYDDVPVFSAIVNPAPVAAAHPTCNHALVADLFDDEA